MSKTCDHLFNVKVEKVANLMARAVPRCTGNKKHFDASVDFCISCGETRCLNFQQTECSYQHSYGSKHPLVYRSAEKCIFCFSCNQNVTTALSLPSQIDISNNKLDKITDTHAKILQMGKQFCQKSPIVEDKLIVSKEIKKKPKAIVTYEEEVCQTQYQEKQQNYKHQQFEQKVHHLQVFGLKNLGNTCFFNSTIQCLYSAQAFHTLYPSLKINPERQFGKIGEIAILFQKFLKNKDKCYSPKSLFNWVCKSKGMYKHMDQQDAQQVLGVILNGLIDSQKFWVGEQAVKLFYKKHKNTITQRIFGFFLASRLQCLGCDKVSWSLDFSLEAAVQLAKLNNKKAEFPQGIIPKQQIGEEGLYYPNLNPTGSILDQFFAPQFFSKQNYFACQSCESEKAFRKFYLKDPPLVLIVTLKRFNNNLSKNNTEIKITQLLEIEGHCLNPGEHKYELFAMIIHSGTARGGHYTAVTRRSKDWFHFSDTSFKPLPWERVRTSQPYILFYQRL